MKVLWFSLSPCGSIRRKGEQRVVQGWMISLEDEIKKNPGVELNVAFFSKVKENPFDYDGVRYYPMYSPISKNKIVRVIERLKSKEEKDKQMLSLMLDVVKDVKPDIIHIHGTEERFGLIQDYIKDTPIVFSIQGLIAPYSEKYFSGLPQAFAYKNDPIYDVMRNAGIKKEYNDFLYKAEREKRVSAKSQICSWKNSMG